MPSRNSVPLLLSVSALLFALDTQAAQTPVALAGTVTSAEEGAMEGVLVNARKVDSNKTITVVSDSKGRYEFPSKYLEPGKYTISIRAAGYDLAAPASADVSGAAASADLKLVKTKDLAAQLSNGEWLHSAPGTDAQKRPLLSCVGCHQLNKITTSRYDTDGFMQTIKRMGTYANQSTFIRPQKRLTGRDTDVVGEDRERLQREQAEYFATINQSVKQGAGWTYDLKAFPRPKGKGTRVVITEWDLPRPTIQPHDVLVDAKGTVWYCDFGDQKLGTLDQKTGKITEIALPELKKGSPNGSLSIRFDRDQNIWLGMMYQGAIGKYDTKSGKLETWPAPPQWNRPNTQINMTSPLNVGVDGKIWAQNNGFAGVHRVDLKTGQWETWEPFKASPVGHNIYDVISDSKNNGWFTDIGHGSVGVVDAKTGQVTMYEPLSKNSGPRRGMMDAQDRMWFAQYRGNSIAMFDTKAERFREWKMPTPWTGPYDVALDKNGEAWTGSMLNDRVVRVNTTNGQTVEYMLPRHTNIRRVFVDNSTNPVSFWVGSNHGASIIKLEPLE